MADMVIKCAIILTLIFTAFMIVTVVVLKIKGWKRNPIGIRLLIIFMWSYIFSLAVLYGTRMLTGGYSLEDTVLYSILFPLAVVSFWIISSRLYKQNLKRPIGRIIQ